MKRATTPKCVLINPYGVYNWFYPKIMKSLRERFDTRFVLDVAGPERDARFQPWCGENDTLIHSWEIEAAARAAPIAPDQDEIARRNEERLDVSYLRDLVQQDRIHSTTFLPYAPALPFSRGRRHSADELTALINFYIDYYDRLFDERGIDMVLDRPAGLISNCCIHAALARGIPVTYINIARHEDCLFWAEGPYLSTGRIKKIYDELPPPELTGKEGVRAIEGLDNLFSNLARQYSFRALLKTVPMAVLVHLIKRWGDLRSGHWRYRLGPLPTILHQLNAWRVWRYLNRTAEHDMDEITSKPFVFFAVPVEPEFTVQSQAKEFANTEAIIEQTALSLPAGFRLIIKEHVIIGNRLPSFYRRLLKIPNVAMAAPYIQGRDLVARCEAVATLAGTVGLEAALLGKRTVAFALHTEYGFLPSVRTVHSFHDLPETLRWATRARSAPEAMQIRRDAARYRDAVAAASFRAPKTPPFFGNATDIADTEFEKSIQQFLDVYRLQLGENDADEQATGTDA